MKIISVVITLVIVIVLASIVLGFIVWPIQGYEERIWNPYREFFGLPIEYMPLMYHLDENSGDHIEDRSNHGNNGVAKVGLPHNSDGDKPPIWAIDKKDILLGASALIFDGVDDYIVVDQSSEKARRYAEMLDHPEDGITIEFFIRVKRELDCDNDDTTNNWKYIISKGYPDTSYEVRLEEDYTISARFKIEGNTYTIKSDTDVGWKKWAHVAITYENRTGTAKIFINGFRDKREVWTPGEIDENTGELRIGGHRFGCPLDAGVPPAVLDEIRIYNIPLPSEEIIFHYQGVGII